MNGTMFVMAVGCPTTMSASISARSPEPEVSPLFLKYGSLKLINEEGSPTPPLCNGDHLFQGSNRANIGRKSGLRLKLYLVKNEAIKPSMRSLARPSP